MDKKLYTIGVVGSSFKENEKRVPLHPAHFELIPDSLRSSIFVEQGYAADFGIHPDMLTPYVGGFLTRAALFDRCDIILLAKPCSEDYPLFAEHQIICGWHHCVQGPGITQVAIDKHLTLIAWEAMFDWHKDHPLSHTFCKNNELAGLASVQHALGLRGQTGLYSCHPPRAVIFGYGATARGAIAALRAQGVKEIVVLSRRAPGQIRDKIPGIHYRQYRTEQGSGQARLTQGEYRSCSLTALLQEREIIVNCVMQDPNRPVTFVSNKALSGLKGGALIIDVSCDEKMGFEFAKPTGFDEPITLLERDIAYYAVDHSPSYLWRTASEVISSALLPLLPDLMAGEERWCENATLANAIEIRDGYICNHNIIDFQRREPRYPHSVRTPQAVPW